MSFIDDFQWQLLNMSIERVLGKEGFEHLKLSLKGHN